VRRPGAHRKRRQQRHAPETTTADQAFITNALQLAVRNRIVGEVDLAGPDL
jgi:hypothetical protein